MSIFIFALLLFFIVGNVYVEAVNEGPGCHWWQESLSHYLFSVPKHTAVQWVSYLGLAFAEVLLIFEQPAGTSATIALALAAAGLVSVVVSAWVHSWPGNDRDGIELWHKVSAGFAFGGALTAEAVYLWRTPDVWFVWGAIATTLAFVRFWPTAQALEEKAFTVWVVVGLIAIAGVPMAA